MSGCTYWTPYLYRISRPVVQITVTYFSPTAISHSPHHYSLFPGGSGCDFQNAFYNIVFLIGNFRSTPPPPPPPTPHHHPHPHSTTPPPHPPPPPHPIPPPHPTPTPPPHPTPPPPPHPPTPLARMMVNVSGLLCQGIMPISGISILVRLHLYIVILNRVPIIKRSESS